MKITKPQLRYFRDEDEDKALKKTGSTAGISATSTQLPLSVGMTKEGTADLGVLFDGKVFPYPKPVELIKYLIQIGTIGKKNATILDFFAGSGTTGQALLKYNLEHEDSNHTFILCTNNENNICREVTYERIKRVIEKEHYAAGLKYYKVDYVPITNRFYYEYADELSKHIRELVELENGIDFSANSEIAIVLTEEELDAFVTHINENSKCNKLYLGYDILMDSQQIQILKDRKVTINIIPDYYYQELEG